MEPIRAAAGRWRPLPSRCSRPSAVHSRARLSRLAPVTSPVFRRRFCTPWCDFIR